MQVASKELSEELYKLTKWETGEWVDPFDNTVISSDDRDMLEDDNDRNAGTYVAYDLGYLLRKLQNVYPHITGTDYAVKLHNIVWDMYPENAAAKLCIELAKANLIPIERKE